MSEGSEGSGLVMSRGVGGYFHMESAKPPAAVQLMLGLGKTYQ